MQNDMIADMLYWASSALNQENTPRSALANGHRLRLLHMADKKNTSSSIKYYVLDTNVLLHNPNAMFVFKENHIVIPYPVLEELDTMKRREDDVGRNARTAIRQLDRLRVHGKLIEGVSLEKLGVHSSGATGWLSIDVEDHTRPPILSKDMPDNRIIAAAWSLHRANNRVVFVSKDLAARIKADALGIKSEDVRDQRVDGERLYTGYMELAVGRDIIDELYADRMLSLDHLEPYLKIETDSGQTYQREITPNQYVMLTDAQDETHSGLARRLTDTEHLIPVAGQRKPTFGIMARNVQQTMALDMLLDDEIKLVTLLGSAGTGKTLLAMAAGMTKVFQEERFDKLLVARPIMPMGRDIGYLPGDKDEKLGAWMQPIFDNLSYLLSTRGSPNQAPESKTSEQRIEKLVADGRLVLEPLTYIRGRSIPHQFMIVDEAQNLTPHEVKTIVSRIGEGTKLVLTGDIGQIDNPYLDQSSNGLSYAVERMRGLSMVGHVTLAKSERSELASLAAERL